MDGTCSLGECFLRGCGAEQDQAHAAALFQRAAEKDSARGMYLLGQCYEKGTGVERDMEKAKKFYQKAADKGHKKSREALERLNPGESAPAPVKAAPAPRPAPAPAPKKEKKGWWPFGKK